MCYLLGSQRDSASGAQRTGLLSCIVGCASSLIFQGMETILLIQLSALVCLAGIVTFPHLIELSHFSPLARDDILRI